MPPKPRNAFFPIVLVLLVLSLVLGVVLSANGGRNLVALFKALDIPIPQFVASIAPAPVPVEIKAPSTGHWPWLKRISHHPQPRLAMARPDEMCASFASEGQERPTFTRSGNDGWECSMLFETPGSTATSSLFLQARGDNGGSFSVVRVKFNLGHGRLVEELSQHALAFLHAVMQLPPSEELDDELGEKLQAADDFYFVAGYHALTFRREIDDPSRYNLIGFNRRLPQTGPVENWSLAAPAGDTLPTKAGKGGRISTESARSH